MTAHRSDRPLMILDAIEEYTATHGYAPSVRDIGERVGLASTSAVHHHLLKLERDGLVRWDRGTARSLCVIRERETGICGRPGCENPLPEPNPYHTRWCSPSCRAIAGHVRQWLRDSGADHLRDRLGVA